jgi:hypothetical protein
LERQLVGSTKKYVSLDFLSVGDSGILVGFVVAVVEHIVLDSRVIVVDIHSLEISLPIVTFQLYWDVSIRQCLVLGRDSDLLICGRRCDGRM